MNIGELKRPSKRFKTSYSSRLGIQIWGENNTYPNEMYNLIQNSSTGGTCLERYMTFIEGNGLNNVEFSEFMCNRQEQTVDDLYRQIAHDIAYYNGFALHVNYNLQCKITEVRHIPFYQTRLEEETEDGRVIYIHVHPDWIGEKTKKGKKIRVDEQNIRKFYTFNPKPDVVLSQINKDGGINAYRGQIMWVSLDGKNIYPTPIYDKVASCLSTDEGLDNVKYRNARNNFLPSGMFIHKKSASIEGGGIYESDAISESLEIFQGDENACSIMDVTIGQDEDEPKFVGFDTKNFDKDFTSTESSVTEKIYAAFGQEPFYMLRIGKVGFSGQVVREAYEYYNSYVERQRRSVSRALMQIFSRWSEHVNSSNDYSIQPLVYVSSESANNQQMQEGMQ